jgi:hypothetical protein
MRWYQSLLVVTLLVLLTTSPIAGQKKEGPFLETDKTITQLLSENFEIKSVVVPAMSQIIIFVLQKKSTLYLCQANSDKKVDRIATYSMKNKEWWSMVWVSEHHRMLFAPVHF